VTHTEILGLLNASPKIISTIRSNLSSLSNSVPTMPTELAIHKSTGTLLRKSRSNNEEEKELIGDNDDND